MPATESLKASLAVQHSLTECIPEREKHVAVAPPASIVPTLLRGNAALDAPASKASRANEAERFVRQ
ncbi:hypothetical protein D9M68_1009100 [compost metagenome]